MERHDKDFLGHSSEVSKLRPRQAIVCNLVVQYLVADLIEFMVDSIVLQCQNVGSTGAESLSSHSLVFFLQVSNSDKIR